MKPDEVLVSKKKVEKSENEWAELLTPFEFHVMRRKGTERAFTGEFWKHDTPGTYSCKGCQTALFHSDTKYDSGCGWPSFHTAVGDTIVEKMDRTMRMVRTEVLCGTCDAHLGHVFPDGPPPTGRRYCINSICLVFEPTSGD